jgi:hypothetical protein
MSIGSHDTVLQPCRLDVDAYVARIRGGALTPWVRLTVT